MTFRIVAEKGAATKFKQNLAGLQDRMDVALTAAANMAASLIQDAARADIAAAGFSGSWVSGLNVEVEGTVKNMIISMYHDDQRALLFERGGVIQGHPLLWIPISGTDAAGKPASEYGGALKSGNPPGHRPMLFSVADKRPKYFGIERVTIPKKFHLAEAQRSVMANFRAIFDQAFRSS